MGLDTVLCCLSGWHAARWGQVLAVQDCVYKAMVSRHRWVVVTDFDEYIVPQKASIPNWPALLNELSKDKNAGQPAMEYKFNGMQLVITHHMVAVCLAALLLGASSLPSHIATRGLRILMAYSQAAICSQRCCTTSGSD